MKKMFQKAKNKGFTIIEMIIVMVIIGVILSTVIAVGNGATDTSRIASTVGSIRSLQTASINYYNANGGSYSSGTLGTISLANMAANNMLPANISGTNSWQGTIAVSPDANANYFDISLTNVPATAQATLTSAVSNLTQTAPTYTAKNSTWTAAF